jgi:hypothetical protein
MKPMRTATLAEAITRETLANINKPVEQSKPDTPTCFACGRPMLARHNTADDNIARFCSKHCRQAYDAGAPAYDISNPNNARRYMDAPLSAWRVIAGPPGVETYDPLAGSQQRSRGIKRRGSSGWIIECVGCGKEFDSKGLRCCSLECERKHLRQRENESIMAEVGMDKPVKRKCQECGGDIPNWVKGKRVSKRRQFCSAKCQQRAAKKPGLAPGAKTPI